MAEHNFQNTVEALFKGMDSFISTKTVVGDAITAGDTILLPLVDVSFGVAAGAFADNAKILSETLLEGREIPVTNELIYRFESFGDLYNAIHLKNYVTIAKHNPYTKFALWTKNYWLLDEVFNKEGIEKPENLSIVVSSPFLNQTMKLDREKYWMVNHVFTVYEKDFIANNDVVINCGARSCLGCRKCYMDDDTFYINEQLK